MKETNLSNTASERQLITKINHPLSLDRLSIYEIKVPGILDESWSEWYGGMEVTVECKNGGPSCTTLTVSVDQAALQGLLRRLYSLGLPLISVNCVECG
jgi:hypothetical protein